MKHRRDLRLELAQFASPAAGGMIVPTSTALERPDMSKITSLYGTTPAEIFESGLENVDEIVSIATAVLWKDGRITTGWSNVDPTHLARMILVLDEKQRRTTVLDLDP